MSKLSKYRWSALVVLAVFCQLILSRVSETSPTQSLSSADLTKVDHAVLVAAPQNPFASAEGKTPEYFKSNGTVSKFIGGWTNQYHVVANNARESISRSEYRDRSSTQLWLLYRSLLL
ncbi:MAG: hypothetical protein AB1861_18990 [Cyanobacteriota bacterium]